MITETLAAAAELPYQNGFGLGNGPWFELIEVVQMGGCNPFDLLKHAAAVMLGGLLLAAAPAKADSTLCNFPRNAWQSAVASGDAGRIAAARQRVVAARHNCPDLYAKVMAWRPPVRERPRTEEPPPRRLDPAPPPPRRELPNPIGNHFRLISRVAKDAPQPQLVDSARGWFLALEAGKIAKFGLATGLRQPVPASALPISQIGAYNAATGTFHAIGKNGELGFCNAATAVCAWPKKSNGLIATGLMPSANPAFDTIVIGKDAKGQAFVHTVKAGKTAAAIVLAPFKLHRTSADDRYFCTIPTRPAAPHELACHDLVKRKPTGRANIGAFIENPVADRTRWDEGDATRQGNFDAAGQRMAIYTDGELRIYDPANLSNARVIRLADVGLPPAGRKFGIRLIDKGARVALWDIREKFDTELFTFLLVDLDNPVPANRDRKFELRFPVRKSGEAETPLAINALYLGNDSFLFEAPFAQPVIFSSREGKYTPFPTPAGERSDAYYSTLVVPEENLLLTKYAAIGDYHAIDLRPGMRYLGRPGSVNVWRLPGPGGYYFFHSLMEGANEWQSEIRQYVAAP